MKRKTWMISALMYAMVFMACFGVLHVLKTLMDAFRACIGLKRRESQVPESIRKRKQGRSGRNRPGWNWATDSQAGETQDEVIRQEGYKEWKKRFPGMWNLRLRRNLHTA